MGVRTEEEAVRVHEPLRRLLGGRMLHIAPPPKFGGREFSHGRSKKPLAGKNLLTPSCLPLTPCKIHTSKVIKGS